MRSILTLFLIILCNSIIIAQNNQVKVMGGSEPESQSKSNFGIVKKNLKLLTIGVGNFEEYGYLSSYLRLSDYKNAITYFKGNYECKLDSSLSGYVKREDVLIKLKELSKDDKTTSTDVIIISLLSHGAEKDGDYYLICSNTKSDQLKETAISGSEILYYLKIIADRGALVIVFLDTCNSGAILGELRDYIPKNNGILAIYASSQKNESAKQISEETYFTNSILNTFQYGNKDAFLPGFLTLKTLRNQVNTAVSNQRKGWQQNPITEFFPKKGIIDGYEIEDYPIMSIIEKENDSNSKENQDNIITNVPVIKNPLKLKNKSKAFLPWAVSPNSGKGLDGILIGVECASFIGMVVCSPLIQPNYQEKIDNATNPWDRNDYRKKGKNAAIGFCASAGIFAASYLWRTIHVHKQISIYNKKKRDQAVSLDIMPNVSYESNGLSLVLNF